MPAGSASTLVLVFGSSEFESRHDVWRELEQLFPESVFLGCSSAGEIDGPEVKDGTISGVAVRFDHTTPVRASAPVNHPSDSFAAGASLARDILRQASERDNRSENGNLRALLVISDGLNVNGSDLLKGIRSVLPDTVLTTGGLAADGSRFERTWVLDRLAPRLGKPPELTAASGRVVGVGLSGERLAISHGCKGGWDKFGPERIVTRSAGSVVYEIDEKPALALYKKYLGDRASGLPATGLLFPLAIRETADSDKVLVRTILKVDEATQSLTFAGDIPQGAYAQLMKANFDRLIQGAADAAHMGWSSLADLHPQFSDVRAGIQATADLSTLALAVSCVGRRLVLGERSEEELEAALQSLPPGTCQVGFYSYGEISPHGPSGNCELHNQTMTLTLVKEID